MSPPEVWLRGAIPGIAPLLQPVAHSFRQLGEEAGRIVDGLAADALWTPVAQGWSIGQHLRHLSGSTDRLLTYAHGRPLSPSQMARLAAEGGPPNPRPDAEAILAETVALLGQVGHELLGWSVRVHELTAPRAVGRAALPSTVLGLLFHAAEHAQRHAAQAALLRRILSTG